MLKPERVTFSADDDKFYQFTNSDQLDSVFNDSLVHYSTDFKHKHQQESSPLTHSNSLNQFPSNTMSSQENQQQQQIEHEPSASSPSAVISDEIPTLNETNLHEYDALTLQKIAIGSSHQNSAGISKEDTQTSPTPSISYLDIKKEVDRVRQMKYSRTYVSPTS